MNKERLLRHVFATYSWLRYGMAVIAFAFPPLLYGWGKLHGLSLQGSMSAYYWASIEGDPPVRVWFVGCIFALGACLFLYKGYTDSEDLMLNVAAVLVILVALFPTSWNCGSENGYCAIWNMHSVFAIAFFACIVYVALAEARKSLPELGQARQQVYRNRYRFTSGLLVLSPVLATIAHLAFQRYQALTYFLELFGIWAFAAFWFIKTRELRESHAEQEVLDEATEAVE